MQQKPDSIALRSPRLRAVAVATSLVFCAGSVSAAEHQLTKINFDAARNVNVLDMVMSIDWDYDNPPAGRDKAFIEGVLRQASQSTFTMTEGRQMLGKVYVYKNSQFMSNTDIQYLQQDGRANAHVAGFTTGKSYRIQQFAGTNETPVDHGKTVAHEVGHYVLGISDEYREAGGTSTAPGSPQDGDTARDSIMHDHLRFTNISTATDYADEALRKTAQFRVYGKSAWELITSDPATDQTNNGRLQFAPFRGMTPPTAATLTRPEKGWESDFQVVYMGGEAGATASVGKAASAAVSGPINVIMIDTTTSAATLTAQLTAAAQIVDSSGNSNRVAVFAHPFSSAPVVPLTRLNSEAARKSVKDVIAKIGADSVTSDAVVAERLLAWAESVYPSYFPAGPVTALASGIHYRLYPTGLAIGVGAGTLYFYNGSLLPLGDAVTQWLPQARQSLNGSLTSALNSLKSRSLADTPAVTLFTSSTQTVDSSLVAAFRAASVAVNAIALNLPSASNLPRLRSTTAGQTSLFDLSKGTFGSFKEAAKAGDLARSAGKVANAAEGDNTETVNEAEAATLAEGASHTMTSTIAAAGLDGQTVFQAFWNTEDNGKLAFSLTTPGGMVVTPASLPAGISYTLNAEEGEASYTVAAHFAGLAGVWTSKVTASQATLESVYQEVTAASGLSASLDVSGGTTADPTPLKVVVEVSGPVAVTGASVMAEIVSNTTGAVVKTGVVLKDDGVGADLKAGDGLYSASLADLPVGEYDITATVTNDGTAVYTTSGNTKMGINQPAEKVPAFQRVTSDSFVKER